MHYWKIRADKGPNAVNWFVSAPSSVELKQGLSELSEKLHLKGGRDEWQQILTEILIHLKQRTAVGTDRDVHHILLDDLDEQSCEDVEQAVRQANVWEEECSQHVKVIVTSNYDNISHSVSVEGFEDREAYAFFRKVTHLKMDPSATVSDLGTKLGYLPLGMAAARAYIAKRKSTISDYLKKLQSENEKFKTAVWESKHLAKDYDHTLLGALRLNLIELKSQLDEVNEELFKQFQMTVFFAEQVT